MAYNMAETTRVSIDNAATRMFPFALRGAKNKTTRVAITFKDGSMIVLLCDAKTGNLLETEIYN